jgi:hypothetical protein
VNTYQAKRIPLQTILAKLGCEPHHTAKGELWYASPFRQESEASFKVNPERNVWYDFGLGDGGNVLDFVTQYYQVSTISEALRKLEGMEGWIAKAPVAPKPSKVTEKDLGESMSVSKVQPLQNTALIKYLQGRGVNVDIARSYVQEIYYTYNYRHYFALAFPNRSGFYEMRNPYYKGVSGHKDISVIPGATDGAAMVFEGFMDFLSALTYYQTATPAITTIVMNSVAMKDKTVEALIAMGVRTVHSYHQHDTSGQTIAGYIREALTGIQVIDQSGVYVGYKDFNEFLQAQQHGGGKTKSGILT